MSMPVMESKPESGSTTVPMACATWGCLAMRGTSESGMGAVLSPMIEDPGGPNHDVGADAAGALRGAVEGAIADAHQGEDHGDLDGDGEHAEGGAYGAMAEIGKYELVDQVMITDSNRLRE